MTLNYTLKRWFDKAVGLVIKTHLLEHLSPPLRNRLNHIYMGVRVALNPSRTPNPCRYNNLLIYYPENSFLGPQLTSGKFETEIRGFLESTLKPGMKFVDVGAHIGIVSLIAAQQGAEIISFEPDPYTYSLLVKNINANLQSEHIQPFNKLVGAQQGKSTLYIESHDRLTSTTVPNLNRGWQAVECEIIMLDNFLEAQNWTKIDCVKIDVEGAEAQVLEGFRQLNTLNPDLKMIIEFAIRNQQAANVEPLHLLELITSLGFNRFTIIGEPQQYTDIHELLNTVTAKYSHTFPNLLCEK